MSVFMRLVWTDDWKEVNVPRLGYQGSTREPGLEEGLVGDHAWSPAQPQFAFLWDHLLTLGLLFFQYVFNI